MCIILPLQYLPCNSRISKGMIPCDMWPTDISYNGCECITKVMLFKNTIIIRNQQQGIQQTNRRNFPVYSEPLSPTFCTKLHPRFISLYKIMIKPTEQYR
jgi:hypothetical protein